MHQNCSCGRPSSIFVDEVGWYCVDEVGEKTETNKFIDEAKYPYNVKCLFEVYVDDTGMFVMVKNDDCRFDESVD